MGGEDYYLELCERPVQFEKANPVNCVFFDEANKQVSERCPQRGPAPGRSPSPYPRCAQGFSAQCPVFCTGAKTGVRVHGWCQSASWLSDGQSQGLACSCTVPCFAHFFLLKFV